MTVQFEIGAGTALQTETFSKTVPGHQRAWDSTSLGELKCCPRRYYYRVVLGFVPRGQSAHLTFGLIYHSALEVYDHRKAEGMSHDDACAEAVGHAMECTWNYTLGRPWASDHNIKTRDSLLRSIVWYLEKFANDPAETVILGNAKPAVELSFRLEPGFKSGIDGREYILCGHLDRVVRFNDQLWDLDRKTTKYTLDENYAGKFTPDNQMSMYSVAGQLIMDEPVKGIIIDAAQVGVTFSRYHRYLVHRHPAVLEEWLKDTSLWLGMAEQFATANYWPMNDKACLMYYSNSDPVYSGCPYRAVCALVPSMRQKHLEAFYDKSPWDPLIVRGDVN